MRWLRKILEIDRGDDVKCAGCGDGFVSPHFRKTVYDDEGKPSNYHSDSINGKNCAAAAGIDHRPVTQEDLLKLRQL